MVGVNAPHGGAGPPLVGAGPLLVGAGGPCDGGQAPLVVVGSHNHFTPKFRFWGTFWPKPGAISKQQIPFYRQQVIDTGKKNVMTKYFSRLICVLLVTQRNETPCATCISYKTADLFSRLGFDVAHPLGLATTMI